MGTFITMVCAVVTGLWLHDLGLSAASWLHDLISRR